MLAGMRTAKVGPNLGASSPGAKARTGNIQFAGDRWKGWSWPEADGPLMSAFDPFWTLALVGTVLQEFTRLAVERLADRV